MEQQQKQTKGVRSLELLYKNGSTSRVLNLLRIFETKSDDPEYTDKPFFLNSRLNKSMIVKHRLRADEEYLMPRRQRVVTKIIFPLVGNALNFGGFSLFVNQNNFRRNLAEAVGADINNENFKRDMETLILINKLPSLDPFLLREFLLHHNIEPGECYFEISPIDVEKMRHFSAMEVSKLIAVAFAGASSDATSELVKKMVDLILSNEADEKLTPFRIALGLEGDAFRDGVFAWRGFLYFKWQLSAIYNDLYDIVKQVDKVMILNCNDLDTRKNIESLAESLKSSIIKVVSDCKGIMSCYDNAFDDLVDRAKAAAFRQFLLESPQMFIQLGHMMGVISHIGTFWRYRFPKTTKPQMNAEDYEDMLSEFVSSLSYNPKGLGIGGLITA